MKIIMDNDGTLTDFNSWINDNAIPYFRDKYNIPIANYDALEIEDIFNIKQYFMELENLTEEEALKKQKTIIEEFWISLRFLSFTMLNKFRDGATKYIQDSIKNGHEVYIYSSRAKTCEKSIIGTIARNFTLIQYRKNGVYLPIENFHFFKNDEDKINGIIDAKPDLVYDDKPEIITALNNHNIRTICVSGKHNRDVKESKLNALVKDFSEEELKNSNNKVFGESNLNCLNRHAKSEIFYKKTLIVRNLVSLKYKPTILNEIDLENLDGTGIVFASNHGKTIDPIVISSYLDTHIHWIGLKRFYDGEDSMFNNSKNKYLREYTSRMFKALEFFPIERIKDNPNANNTKALKDMQLFLKNNQHIGIFPEGTTNKPDGLETIEFDRSFIKLAKRNKSYIQPIAIYWSKDESLDSKVLMNFAPAFKIDNITEVEAYMKFMDIELNLLEECKDYESHLSQKKRIKKR